MAIETQESISGFIATEPRLSYTEDGTARFYARIGIEHSRREADGSFTQLDSSFHDLTIFRRAAEESIGRFRKGDKFVAAGRVHEYSYEKDGQSVQAEEFIANRIGHDVARTRYEVDRTPRNDVGREAAVREAPVRDGAAFDAPVGSAQRGAGSALGL